MLLNFESFKNSKQFFVISFIINLLHGAQSQSMADYLQQVAYSFRGFRGWKPSLQTDRDIAIVRRNQKWNLDKGCS